MSLRDDLARVTHACRDHAIDGTPLGDRPLCNCYDYADHILGSDFIKRIRADVWDEGALWAAVECGAIPHEGVGWLGTDDNPYRESADV
jgi:hypothetical protein